MLRLASDVDVQGAVIRGIRRRMPDIELVRTQDILGQAATDAEILSWAAADNRIVITNDRNTMVGLAYRRAAAAESVAGIIVTTNKQSIGLTIDDILLIALNMSEEEIRNHIVVFLPL